MSNRNRTAGDPAELILQDVRCFAGEQRARVRPITLLVGENSTGKTTFLGCYGALHRMLSGVGLIDELSDFNEEPFAMGSFRDIVRLRRGPEGRIKEFRLGFALDGPVDPPGERLTATFREEGSQPIVASLRVDFRRDEFLELQRSEKGTVICAAGTEPQDTDLPFQHVPYLLPALANTSRSVVSRRFPALRPVLKRLRGSHFLGEAGDILGIRNLSDLVPVAPLRSKPKRTYDPVRETASPEGEHVPMLMMRLDRTDKRHWDSLHEELVEFGRSAGLFSDIKVKRHGRQMSDPFQLQVKVRTGPHANIMDVGYGVSQSLPILVDVMGANGASRRPGGRTFLLQQPEVHLHPRGQAQLANLFIKAFKERDNRFLIETHSDYIVDRVRISVRQGLLEPDDVSILYFEPTSRAVNIHSMHIDDDGNLEGAPIGYRDFFLKETDKLLGFVD